MAQLAWHTPKWKDLNTCIIARTHPHSCAHVHTCIAMCTPKQTKDYIRSTFVEKKWIILLLCFSHLSNKTLGFTHGYLLNLSPAWNYLATSLSGVVRSIQNSLKISSCLICLILANWQSPFPNILNLTPTVFLPSSLSPNKLSYPM